MTLDDLRVEHPELGFAIYAYTPGGDVILEIHDVEGEVKSWVGESVEEVLAAAFPPPDVFD